MSAAPPRGLHGVTHVMVGYGAQLMAEVDRLLPAASVLIVEEPHVVKARDVHRAAAEHPCVAGVLSAATQDEARAHALAWSVPRPPDVRAVVPALEYGVVAAATLATAWGLPGGGAGAARILRNKLELRRAAARRGITQPEFAEATGPADVDALRARFDGSCVLKPANRQASLGVVLLGPGDDTEAAWRHTVAADEPRLRVHYADAAQYLVEQRLHGPEVSVEALVHDGVIGFLNVTAKQVLPGRYPVELGHTVPAPADEPGGAAREALSVAMAELVDAIGFSTGILHAEWVLTSDRPHLIECAGRLPGDHIPALIDLAYGGDGLVADLFALLAGDGPRPARVARRGAAIRFLPTPDPDVPEAVVRSVIGIAEAERLDGVRDVAVALVEGARVNEVTNSWQRGGHVVATGPTPSEAARTAERAAALVAITVGPRTGGEQ
ncbi:MULTISPECIES: ATP-grasp domain-containing protein [Streptomyces]|uniref:ATP-grasp domain-containing protein n=1 Tax=Streptomyces rugosispiralis TaxID=2967341 RepID=A0ABT1UNI1_9ACTN|nr:MULTISPECIES: ATP-grasp domain-containing protein [Streptomyces]MBA6436580.1 ATP-grasp domain-containing protein [Streptomyces sp. GMR22]MCQ8186686.1 ATP-grasp domain-containing protein [Streptomyces rugosispiralis]